MENGAIELIRDLRELIRDSGSSGLRDICAKLADITDADVYIIDNQGKLVVSDIVKDSNQIFRLKSGLDGKYIDKRLNDQFSGIAETKENIDISDYNIKNLTKAELSAFKAVIIPLGAFGERLGVMILIKAQHDFDDVQIVVSECCAAIISIMISNGQKEASAEEARRLNTVRSAISTLSYSELEAIVHIFNELPGSEGLLVTSKIADKVGITRSVIVNALRKFESAGVIESRSLGMKGTYIKVLNISLIDELNKLRK